MNKSVFMQSSDVNITRLIDIFEEHGIYTAKLFKSGSFDTNGYEIPVENKFAFINNEFSGHVIISTEQQIITFQTECAFINKDLTVDEKLKIATDLNLIQLSLNRVYYYHERDTILIEFDVPYPYGNLSIMDIIASFAMFTNGITNTIKDFGQLVRLPYNKQDIEKVINDFQKTQVVDTQTKGE